MQEIARTIGIIRNLWINNNYPYRAVVNVTEG